MKLQFLQTFAHGMRWMKQYYTTRPQLNYVTAKLSLRATLQRIKSSPPAKETFDGFENVWEAKITRTAFSILYSIYGDTVFVIDVRDQRGNRSATALRHFRIEL